MPSRPYLNLPAEAQARIVQASLEEFAERGYDLASTNRIVAAAGISKGVLFKYFRDKEALFLYVAARAVETYLAALPSAAGGDIFDWLRATTAYKLRFVHEEPTVYRLSARLMNEPHHPVYQKVLPRIRALQAAAVDLAALVPVDALRPGVRPDDVVQLVVWVAAGITERFMPTAPDTVDERFDALYRSLVEEFDHYVTILKAGLFQAAVPS
jgi:AcrR family transcriptional regulator